MSDPSKPETSGSAQSATPASTQPDKETLKKLTAGFKPGDVIVNRDEELRMRDPAVRKRISESIAKAVGNCLGQRGGDGGMNFKNVT